METLKRLGKWFLISGCVGMAVGVVATGLAKAISWHKFDHHLDFLGLFLLLLAPGMIADLGMLPVLELLMDVVIVNFCDLWVPRPVGGHCAEFNRRQQPA